jgi:hypothetical protein
MQMHAVFLNRWAAFHAPIMSAAFVMDKEFCRRDLSSEMRTDVYAVMKDFATAPGSPSYNDMKAEYAVFRDALGSQKVCLLSMCVVLA